MKTFWTDCEIWRGYKPCSKQKEGLVSGCAGCKFYSPVKENVLIIEAGGLGSALRTSVVAKELRSRYPNSLIQWLTNERVVELSRNIPSVNRVHATAWESLTILKSQVYDLVVNFESSLLYLTIAKELQAKEKKGFAINRVGNLTLASSSAEEFLWLQTNDTFRRKENKKPMQQFLLETAGLEWEKQVYDLVTKQEDDEWAIAFLKAQGITDTEILVGLNIGSSLRHSAKRWPARCFYDLAKLCQDRYPEWKLLILSGPEDIG